MIVMINVAIGLPQIQYSATSLTNAFLKTEKKGCKL